MMQAPTAGQMPPSDSEEETSGSEETDSEEEEPVRKPRLAVPVEPKKYGPLNFKQGTSHISLLWPAMQQAFKGE